MQICSENKRLSPFFSAPKSKLDGIRPRFLERPSRFCVGAIGRVFLLAQSRSAVVLPGHFPAVPGSRRPRHAAPRQLPDVFRLWLHRPFAAVASAAADTFASVR